MSKLSADLVHRFGDHVEAEAPDAHAAAVFECMARRGSCRRFKPDPVSQALIETLCALALASPSKSDLQQRDIVIIQDAAIRSRINELLADQEWIKGAPCLLIFLGNNRRQRQVHEWRGLAFANDHLDAFFNAAVDAGIALSAFVLAAEAVGLGCCPISVIRNHSDEVSRMLRLPDHVFPVAGLAFGWPLQPTYMSSAATAVGYGASRSLSRLHEGNGRRLRCQAQRRVSLPRPARRRRVRRKPSLRLERGQGPPVCAAGASRFRRFHQKERIQFGLNCMVPFSGIVMFAI